MLKIFFKNFCFIRSAKPGLRFRNVKINVGFICAQNFIEEWSCWIIFHFSHRCDLHYHLDTSFLLIPLFLSTLMRIFFYLGRKERFFYWRRKPVTFPLGDGSLIFHPLMARHTHFFQLWNKFLPNKITSMAKYWASFYYNHFNNSKPDLILQLEQKSVTFSTLTQMKLYSWMLLIFQWLAQELNF